MGKFVVRITVVLTAIYLILSYLVAQTICIDVLRPYYNILFELCVVIYTFSEGKYHCKYIKYTALAILLADVLTYMDNSINFLTVEAHNLIPIFLIASSILLGVTLAIKHYIKVRKLKTRHDARDIKNKEDGLIHNRQH